MLHEIELELFSELTHCVEDYPHRSWERLRELGRLRDSVYGTFIPITMWHAWLPRLERYLQKLLARPDALSSYEEELWESLVHYAPHHIPDADIDEVQHPLYVQDRLMLFHVRHMPPELDTSEQQDAA